MTEKEKMQKQMLYDANNDRDLLDERTKAKDLCYQFNQLRPSDEKGQQELMKQLLGKTKEHFVLLPHFGVIMATILKLEKISLPITIQLFLMEQK